MRNIKDTQNFLHSKELVRHLIGICNIKLDDVVIEIGPGKGIITNELAHKVSKVIAIEFDEELYKRLKNKFQGNNKVDIIYGDILKTSKREVSLQDAIQTAQEFATRSTVPGTSVEPITAADVQVDKNTGVVTVTVIEDFSTVELKNQTTGVTG